MPAHNVLRELEQADASGDTTDVTFGGDLTVDLTSTLTGAVSMGSTLAVTGATTHTGAVTNSDAVTTVGATVHTGGDRTLMITTADAAVSISAANSGKVHLVPDLTADRIYTLPPNAAGLYYEFWSTRVDADGHDLQIVADNAADFYKGTLVWYDTNASPTVFALLSPDGTSDHTLNLILPIAFKIKMYCDGTNWFITGDVFADATPTWT